MHPTFTPCLPDGAGFYSFIGGCRVSKFNQVPLSELKTLLPHCKRQIQLGMRRVALSREGEIVAFLVPLSDLKRIEEAETVAAIPEVSISEFRADIEGTLKFFDAGGCCIYITSC